MNQPNTDLSGFNSILSLIKTAKDRILKTVNTEIIDLYWRIGKEVSEKAQNGGWGKSIVEELSNHIVANFWKMRGFSPQNIWRMKQFYETYKDSQILSAVLRECIISFHHQHLQSKTKKVYDKQYE
jgi:hypothetical protein